MTTASYNTMIKMLTKINVERREPEPIPRTLTGILSIDTLFMGGIPGERMIQIFGPEGSGKSTIGTILIPRQYIAQGKRVAILDSERSFDIDYARKFGFDPLVVDEDGDPLLDIFRARSAEEWLEAMLLILKNDRYDLIVIDSLAKFAPRVELESDLDKANMAVFPRMLSKFTRIISAIDYKATILVLNQERLDLGNVNKYTGAAKIAPGGKAMRHEFTVDLHMMTPKDIRNSKEEVVGIMLRARVEKSKIFSPDTKRIHEIRISVQNNIHEIDTSYELYSEAKRLGLLVDKEGKPYEKLVAYYQGEKIGNGERQILEFLDEPSELRERLESAVRSAATSAGSGHPAPLPEAEAGLWDGPPDQPGDGIDEDLEGTAGAGGAWLALEGPWEGDWAGAGDEPVEG